MRAKGAEQKKDLMDVWVRQRRTSVSGGGSGSPNESESSNVTPTTQSPAEGAGKKQTWAVLGGGQDRPKPDPEGLRGSQGNLSEVVVLMPGGIKK